MNRLLTLPTWQIFVFFLLPSFFPDSISGVLIGVWVIIALVWLFYFATSLYEKLPQGHDLNIKTFHYNFVFVVLSLVANLIFFDGALVIDQDNYKIYGWWLAIILPWSFYLTYCFFVFIPCFIAKSIATIEQHEVVSFDAYSKDMFLLLFFPVGVWFIHPRVQKIFSSTS
ncbi:MAG TPA: hypothetical protein VK174_12205 [Chitinophagales bacterium]|nr:hypothetical protein [Chitinophagales bacterium]